MAGASREGCPAAAPGNSRASRPSRPMAASTSRLTRPGCPVSASGRSSSAACARTRAANACCAAVSPNDVTAGLLPGASGRARCPACRS